MVSGRRDGLLIEFEELITEDSAVFSIVVYCVVTELSDWTNVEETRKLELYVLVDAFRVLLTC